MIPLRPEARRKGDAATLIKKAAADQAGYDANKMAEDARANMNRSTQTADIVVPAQIEKEKVVIEAEADRDQTVLDGKGKGEAIQVTMEGEANGIKAILERKAEGFERIVAAAGGDPDKAAVLMIVEQLPKIAVLQAQASPRSSSTRLWSWMAEAVMVMALPPRIGCPVLPRHYRDCTSLPTWQGSNCPTRWASS